MNEQSKSRERRKLDPRFAERWFVGRGIDVGCGGDPLSTSDWPRISELVPYDQEMGSGNGMYLSDVGDGSFDFVHSSHSLEHMQNPRVALSNWLRVLRPGGYIVCTVPDEFLYELGRWPSRFNQDHKVSFTLRSMPVIPGSANVAMLLWKLPVDVEHLSLITQGWDPKKVGNDQTLTGAECAIEFVVRKPHESKLW